MGGLLAAEVALLPLNNLSATPLRHRIMGTINLDVPFLGVHPGIVASGISSLFRKAPDQPSEEKVSAQEPLMTPSTSSDLLSPSPSSVSQIGDTSTINTVATSSNVALSTGSLSLDSRDNPSGVPEATDSKQSKLSRAFYFINKHSDGLTKATKSYLTSHIEFGGCLADYKGLMNRYSAIKALEQNPRSRVRFINFYTASTGRAKRPKLPDSVEDGEQPTISEEGKPAADQNTRDSDLSGCDTELHLLSPQASTIRDDGAAADSYVVSSENSSDSEPLERSEENTIEVLNQCFINLTDPPTRESPRIPSFSTSATELENNSSNLPSADFLPSLPDHPSKPPPFDSSMYPNKDALKIASRDHDRALKTYNRLLKDRDNAIKDRRKILDKRAKAAEKERRDEARNASKRKARLDEKATAPMVGNDDSGHGMENATTATSEAQPIQAASTPSPPPPAISKPTSTTSTTPAKAPKPPKQPKPRKYRPFCLLPHQRDPTWIRVVMRDTDEIEAHCGLFARDGEHYAGFVTAVVECIGTWIQEASIDRENLP